MEPETGLVTDAVLAPANTSDAEVAPALLEGEDPGVEVLGDSAYGSGRLRADLDAAGHTATIKPIPSRPAVPGGFGRDDFTVDHETNSVTCPAGVTVSFGRSLKAHVGSRCPGCPLQAHCTTSPKGRTVTLNLYDIELEAARRRAETEEFQLVYRRWRPMVERSIA